ncbi:MAG TPA: hypothetical protein V6C58_13075 [Allocoleopsis sp.]
MGKESIFLLLGAFTQIALMLFGGSGIVSTNPGILIGSENGSSTVTDIVARPDLWYENPLFTFFQNSFGQFLVAGALLVGALFFRNERVIYLGIAAVFLTFIIPLINLWQFLAGQGFGGPASFFICSIFVSPFIVMGIGVILDFSQGK